MNHFLGKKQSKSDSKYDLDSFPEDIQKHIKEKEEELNSNAMINGKAKEYIDNLIKIPFGKYKEENIFKFLREFINNINNVYKEKDDKDDNTPKLKHKKRKHVYFCDIFKKINKNIINTLLYNQNSIKYFFKLFS